MNGPETLIILGGLLVVLSTIRKPMPKAVVRFTEMLDRGERRPSPPALLR